MLHFHVFEKTDWVSQKRFFKNTACHSLGDTTWYTAAGHGIGTEWSRLSTFRLYIQFHAVFAGATAARRPLSDLIDSFTEADYEKANGQAQHAQPFATSAKNGKD